MRKSTGILGGHMRTWILVAVLLSGCSDSTVTLSGRDPDMSALDQRGGSPDTSGRPDLPDTGGQRDLGAGQSDMPEMMDLGGMTDLGDMAADSGARANPDIVLLREITFEQPDGTNGWSAPASVIFDWLDAPTGRTRVPDAFVRMATAINVPTIVADDAYRGDSAARLVMEDWGSDTFRQDLEMLGNENVISYFPQGETHVVGFAMMIEHDNYLTGGFQLYHQYHNSSPGKSGYGSTLNPALSLLRENDTDLVVAIRDNRPNGERLNTFETIPNSVRAGQWVRWVFKTRFANFDSGENGLVEVWSGVGNDPLTMHIRVDDRPIGYTYANPAHSHERIFFSMYGTPMQNDAAVRVDEIRIASGDVDVSVVDPLNWVSYQHALNQNYNDDLLEAEGR